RRRACMLDLLAQILHLSDGEARIVSDDHDGGALEDTVERRDELLFSRSIHCKLFPVWRPVPGGTITAGYDLLPRSGGNAAQFLPTGWRERRAPGLVEVRTGREHAMRTAVSCSPVYERD